MVKQDSLGRFIDNAKYPNFRVARVTDMNIDTNTADVAFFDGSFANDIPILGPLTGTNFGVSNVTTVTEDATQEPAEGTFLPGGSAIPNLDNIDVYAVVGTFDSPRVIKSFFIVGFISPAITAMKFDPELLNNPEHLTVIRHPSDVQITIDDNACISIQHPCGARISIGDINATDGSNLMGRKVDLNNKDVNLDPATGKGLYQIRNNVSRQAGIILETCVGSKALMDLDGSVKINDTNGNFVTLDSTGITIDSPRGDIDVNSHTGDINTDSNNTNMQSTINININAGVEVNIQAGALISLKAPLITLNGVGL